MPRQNVVHLQNERLGAKLDSDFSDMIPAIIVSLRHFLGWLVSVFRSREELVLENLALRRQLLALHAQQPRRRLTALHKLFWVALRTCWSGWTKPLILVTPRTVVNWHRAGFRLYWTWVSRVSQVGGRKRVSKEVRALIFRMVSENPTWGAPRIHGELLKLGFDLSERSVSRWIRRAPKDPDPMKRWLTFLRNHREAIAAMDFFTVPTLTFGVLYCFFVIGHDRRKILHFNVTRNPNALWVVQQLREAWTYKQPHRFLLFDRDAKFGAEVLSAVRDMGSEPTRTAFRSPWQNGVAERWVGSCRRDLLDHVIILNDPGRFNPFRDSVACTIVMQWQRRVRNYFSGGQILFCNPGAAQFLCEHVRGSTNQPTIPNGNLPPKRKKSF